MIDQTGRTDRLSQLGWNYLPCKKIFPLVQIPKHLPLSYSAKFPALQRLGFDV